MPPFLNKLPLLALGISLAALLTSCGGGSSSGDSQIDTQADAIQGKGTVGILLTDKPADPALFASINASIESIVLLDSEDGDKTELYSGPTKTFDLLRLRNESIPFSFKDNVPTGTYCKIRLILSDLELVLADDTPTDSTDNEVYHPKLPGNGKLDLVARDCFTVAAGEVLTLQLDIDAGNSIHIVGNGTKERYNVRPVVFVDVLKQDFDSKLVRLHGKITKVDDLQGKLLLCEALPTEQMDTRGCVDVHLGEDSAFFDNVDFMGAPRPLGELLSADRIRQEITVVGWPRHSIESHFDFDVPEENYPAPGECILWDINLEPGQQADPIDCDAVPDELPVDIVVVTHEGVEDDLFHPLMAVDGLVVELGEFLQVEGEVAFDPSPNVDGFSMNVLSADAAITDNLLDVMLQQGGIDFNGTRIVSRSGRSGELLDSSAILSGLPVQVDGTLEAITSVEQLLRAALVVVDTDDPGAEQVTGEIVVLNDSSSLVLDPDESTVCGVSGDMLTVNLAPDLELLTVTITETSSSIVPGGTLAAGQSVGVNGVCQLEALYTDNLVIVDDQRILP